MGPLINPGTTRMVSAGAVGIALVLLLAACGQAYRAKIRYAGHTPSPDGKLVAFTAACQWEKRIGRLETVVLGSSRGDSTTWSQLTDWASYEIRELAWTDDGTLRIRARPKAERTPTHFRLDTCRGVKLVWELE